MTETKPSDNEQLILLQKALMVLRFQCVLYRSMNHLARCSKTAPGHNCTTSMFHCRYRFLYCMFHVWVYKETAAGTCCQKAPVCLICPGHSPKIFPLISLEIGLSSLVIICIILFCYLLTFSFSCYVQRCWLPRVQDMG